MNPIVIKRCLFESAMDQIDAEIRDAGGIEKWRREEWAKTYPERSEQEIDELCNRLEGKESK